jgi:hypothetical protein
VVSPKINPPNKANGGEMKPLADAINPRKNRMQDAREKNFPVRAK